MQAHTTAPCSSRILPRRSAATRCLRAALLVAITGWLCAPWQLAAASSYYTFFHAGIPGIVNGQYSRLTLDNGPLGNWPVPQRFVALAWEDSGGGGFIWTDGGVYFGIVPQGFAPRGIAGNSIALMTPDHTQCGWWYYARTWPPMPVNTTNFLPGDCTVNGMNTGSGVFLIGSALASSGYEQPMTFQCDPNPRVNNCNKSFLPTLGGAGTDTYARGINDYGMIVGDGNMPSGAIRAWYASVNAGGVSDFDPLHPNYNSWANAINDSNQSVGWIIPGGCPPAPFSCKNGAFWSQTSNSHYLPAAFAMGLKSGGVTPIPTLGGYDGAAIAINNYGQVVGWSTTRSGATHAFLYSNGVVTDLNNLNASGAAGWTMYEADAINDEGQILGRATNAAGQTEIFILTP